MDLDLPSSGIASPFLRWAGSKRAILPKLTQKFPNKFNKYIEPFVGSACLFFRLLPSIAVLNDLNEELIETYRAVRRDPSAVGTILSGMPVGRDAYYAVRGIDIQTLSAVERAARFIFLNRFCFNALYRTNLHGKFNVPYGAPKNYRVPSVQELKACALALEAAELTCDDFEVVVRNNLDHGDLVYMDPPFYRTSKRVFREYNARPFDGVDLDRLSKLLHWIDQRGATFFLSYAYCKEAKSKFSEWNYFTTYTTRNISGFAEHRKRAREIIFTNFSR
jgi:DNA adenine methylase